MNSTLVLIEKEFSVNDAAIGLMSGLFTILGAVVSIVWGYLTDKKNRKLLFVYSILLGQIPCLLTAFVQNYPQFFILRILTGIGVGVSFSDHFLPDRRHVRGEGKGIRGDVDGHRHRVGPDTRPAPRRIPRPRFRMAVPVPGHRVARD